MHGWQATKERRTRQWRHLAVVAVAVLALCAGGLWAAEGQIVAPDYNPYVPLPENISTYGGDIDHLFNLILWITGVTFVITEGLLIYTLLAFRHREGHKSDYVHGNHNLEIAWTVVPALLLVGLAIYQLGPWKHIKMDNMDPNAPDVLHVQVLAKQFEWNFRYAGEDRVFGADPKHPENEADDIYSTGRLVIPKGTKVVVEMRSTDVIHSLFLPYFRFKQDLMPGMTVHGWFEATKTTKEGQTERNNPFFNYEIACAELCGPQHGRMRAQLVILEKAEFEEWKKDQAKFWESHEIPAVWAPMADRSDTDKALGWDSPYSVGVMPPPPEHAAEHAAEPAAAPAH
ncbi:MAG TPA: cytochrome c oxidase subunit II [Planctomycetota bacterium]|nr:cytochrome c oxidase subunit II [Planctomycetota bacterium]